MSQAKKIKKIDSGYPPEFCDTFKSYIRKRDGLVCSICSQNKRLDVHHIDYVKMHTTRENCISLCRECHDMVHGSTWSQKHEWKMKLWRLAAKREREHAYHTRTGQAVRTR